jgi:hypothetical protein
VQGHSRSQKRGRRFLADGFHRKDICDRLGKPYPTRDVAFDDEADVLAWIERNARGRRNETRTERKYYLGRRYNREKDQDNGRGNLKNGGPGRGKKSGGHSDHPISDRTCDRIAQEEQVSPKTVTRAGSFALRLDEACQGQMAWLRDLILSERVVVPASLLKPLTERGAEALALLPASGKLIVPAGPLTAGPSWRTPTTSSLPASRNCSAAPSTRRTRSGRTTRRTRR